MIVIPPPIIVHVYQSINPYVSFIIIIHALVTLFLFDHVRYVLHFYCHCPPLVIITPYLSVCVNADLIIDDDDGDNEGDDDRCVCARNTDDNGHTCARQRVSRYVYVRHIHTYIHTITTNISRSSLSIVRLLIMHGCWWHDCS